MSFCEISNIITVIYSNLCVILFLKKNEDSSSYRAELNLLLGMFMLGVSYDILLCILLPVLIHTLVVAVIVLLGFFIWLIASCWKFKVIVFYFINYMLAAVRVTTVL